MIEPTKTYGKLQGTVLRRIRAKGVKWAFTPNDFADLGDARSVGMTLTRLVRQGVIRRLRRGLYDIPHQHPEIGMIGASAEALTEAIARRDATKLLPAGGHAANALGMCNQVAVVLAFGTAGRSRVLPLRGRATVTFRHCSPRRMALAGRPGGWLAEAMRNLGKKHITTQRLRAFREAIGPKERRELLEDVRYVPNWMRPFFLELARHKPTTPP